MINKKRLDVLLFERNLAPSREKARAIIMSGNVYIDNQKADKPGISYKNDIKIEVKSPSNLYVSRGGLKIEKAINSFNINLKDKIVMDVGASTGGFTDCMLQHGASKVYSVDVGFGQLAWKLRNNPKVVNLERTNIRYLDENVVKDKIDFFSVDVSFISLKIVLPTMKKFLKNDTTAVCLIKPQFEAGRNKVGKNGVIKNVEIHKFVIKDICEFIKNIEFDIIDLDYSPIKGPKGNIEYLVYIKNTQGPANIYCDEIDSVIERSHAELD